MPHTLTPHTLTPHTLTPSHSHISPTHTGTDIRSWCAEQSASDQFSHRLLRPHPLHPRLCQRQGRSVDPTSSHAHYRDFPSQYILCTKVLASFPGSPLLLLYFVGMRGKPWELGYQWYRDSPLPFTSCNVLCTRGFPIYITTLL